MDDTAHLSASPANARHLERSIAQLRSNKVAPTIGESLFSEFLALRGLEQAVRAMGAPSMLVSGQKQLDALAAALKDIEAARVHGSELAGTLNPVHDFGGGDVE